jgi:hypothetical protein
MLVMAGVIVTVTSVITQAGPKLTEIAITTACRQATSTSRSSSS